MARAMLLEAPATFVGSEPVAATLVLQLLEHFGGLRSEQNHQRLLVCPAVSLQDFRTLLEQFAFDLGWARLRLMLHAPLMGRK